MVKIVRKTAKIFLPKTTVYYIKRLIEENRFKQYAQAKLGFNFRSVTPGPVPSKELIAKTAALDELELEKQSNADVYMVSMVLNSVPFPAEKI